MLQNLIKYMKGAFTSTLLIGGSSLGQQRRDLEQAPDLVVATTGRLLDHIHNTKGFTLEHIECLVLDEADKLLEMGFKEELMEILKHCTSPKRQTLMVSATLTQDIKELATLALKQPLQFTVSQQQKLADIASLRLTQYIVRLPDKEEKVAAKPKAIRVEEPTAEEEPEDEDSADEDLGSDSNGADGSDGSDNEEPAGSDDDEGEDDGSSDGENTYDDEDDDSADYSSDDDDRPKKKKKGGKKKEVVIKEVPADPYLIRREATLLTLCLKSFKKRVIVFFNEKVQCHRMLVIFKIFGLKAAEVQGNLTQQERMDAIEQFQRGNVDYLLATDLVARGLDIPNVKTVINFSFPNEPKRYLHRVGRTARAGMHGVSVTLCNDGERTDIKKLTRKLGHQVTPYSTQPKVVQRIFTLLLDKLDQLVKDL